jgi:hypothetical protein
VGGFAYQVSDPERALTVPFWPNCPCDGGMYRDIALTGTGQEA